ncbi:uncharacterized protein K452DRAFT_293951 [Aplosporella prunicola CBS 121167]|uniref:aldehyde dehydrogenase (NAD(+)) n=1 Tax=Aplosporella prunicola CBS 121167 TaxID=1176127 RepID=A0A6A6BW78_9PEZI|nr:uncharacterized protein K452DRAFT_293951 [Aplosporella prunicola CBS 121167]KAF2147555.1 hypothetical protein K452DRAFT_293951 [Aplosporella prunicola CBS 121167]
MPSTEERSANGDASYKIEFTKFYNTINNELSSTATTRHSIDPATQGTLAEVPVSTKADLDAAVKHARAAFPPWAATPWEERAAKLRAFADAIEVNKHEITHMVVLESGKAITTANIEVSLAVNHLRETAKLQLPEEVLEDTDERTTIVRYPPIGVAAAIVPWNWPLLLCVGKLGPALLAGNTIIIKPSPFTPYTDLKLGELGAKVFPPGVLQVLSGDDDLGPMITEHPGIDKISFTGSTFTGKKVMESCSRTLKRVTLELGGNDAAIIYPDVDLDKVVPKIAILAFLSTGQVCMLVKRIYVHASIYESFRDALVAFTRNLRTGPGSDPEVFCGPIQNSMQFAKVQDMYASIAKEGWTAALGGVDAGPEHHSGGYFIEPAIIDNPPDDSRIVTEEPFGPIVPLLKWEDEEDVVHRANDTKMGLGASVWSKDIQRAHRVARKLEAGSVWVNSHFDVSPNVPFGGHKWSGLGMEWGVRGLKEWCNTQSLWLRKDF